MTDAGMDAQRKLRHEAKNLLNALRLNTEVLDVIDDEGERLECLAAIEEITGEFEAWVEQFERHYECPPAPDPA